MIRLLLIILVLLGSSTITFGQEDLRERIRNDFPSFEEVYSYLYNDISKPLKDEYLFGLSKKVDGYYIKIREVKDGTYHLVEESMLWNASTQQFISPNIDQYSRLELEGNGAISEVSKLWPNRARFDFMLLYGYGNWAEDIIDVLKNAKNLTASDHEQLARAYSHLAESYVYPGISGYTPDFAKDFVHSNYEMISKERIKNCLSNFDLSFKHWNKVLEIDPDHEPFIITNLQVKISNEYMHAYGMLMSIREEEIARKFLDKVQFPKAYLDYAKLVFSDCRENSFLFTNGDVDSFPLCTCKQSVDSAQMFVC